MSVVIIVIYTNTSLVHYDIKFYFNIINGKVSARPVLMNYVTEIGGNSVL